MRTVELLGVAFAALRRNRLRTALTAVGVVISVATIIAVVGVVFGVNDLVLNSVPLKPDVLVVTRFGIIFGRDEFLAALKRKRITREDADRVRELCESCGEVAHQMRSQRDVRSGGRRIAEVPVVGATANIASMYGLDVVEGRFFTDLEDEHRSPVAIIGAEVREELFPRVDPIGRPIWIGPAPHTVIGVLKKEGNVLDDDGDLQVYIPFNALTKLVGKVQGPFGSVGVFVRPAEGLAGVPRTEEELYQIFRWIRHTAIGEPSPVAVVTQELFQSRFRQLTFATFAFIVVLASISLFVGALVVANIMLVSVVERTREIGVRLALGARKRDIRRQFLYEAAALTASGGVLGIGLGALIAWVVRENTPLPTAVRGWVVLAATGTAILAGLVAGFFPARRAANLAPIEALRHE